MQIGNRYFVRNDFGMGIAQLREELHEYIDKADSRTLWLGKGMFQAEQSYTAS